MKMLCKSSSLLPVTQRAHWKANPGDIVPFVNVKQLLPVDYTINVIDSIPLSLSHASVTCGQIVQLADKL